MCRSSHTELICWREKSLRTLLRICGKHSRFSPPTTKQEMGSHSRTVSHLSVDRSDGMKSGPDITGERVLVPPSGESRRSAERAHGTQMKLLQSLLKSGMGLKARALHVAAGGEDVLVGRQLGGATAKVALADEVVVAADDLLVTRHGACRSLCRSARESR
ncbi:hypothetical protein EYF80_005883 [Liparis tanakae]|uniref:Uncharacterized protein n=1 Tax=Liparis tanakae TaxID=230148 RepID=A0A4Z2J3J9_9TELE|nr:hypothetical protein EYF80_005883 [Liparis tanakae]